MSGPFLLAPEPPRPPRPPTPHEQLVLADALEKLIMVHPTGAEPDYPILRSYLEARIRSTLGLAPALPFDGEAWADEITEGGISWTRQRV